ncbi:MAG: S8 family serine peptidase [Candidatus Cybelea sp.]
MSAKLCLRALGASIAIASTSACGSQRQVIPPASMQISAGVRLGAVPACTGSRIGQAQCDVLVEVGSAASHYEGWTASQLEKAYKLPSSSKGEGQTVAIVAAYDNPRVANDLAKYRAAMGLPKAKFKKYNQQGEQGNYPSGNPAWGIEMALDVEMVSASCPKCKIDLVEANSNSWYDLDTTEAEAVKLGATIVSNSYSGRGGDPSYFDTNGVTYLASAGDDGLGILNPADFDDVVAVGGTQLAKSKSGRGYTETIWTQSSHGCSTQPKPPWQHDTTCKYRLANDVSAVAKGVSEYDTYPQGGWFEIDGTSISCPFLAGVFGLAGNSTSQGGGRTFWFRGHRKYLNEVSGKRYSQQAGWGSPEGIGAF